MSSETSDSTTAASPHTTIRRHPERALTETADIAAILAAGLVAHVGFADEGQPYVIPMTYHFDPDQPRMLYLHGGHPGRLLKHLASGARICVEVLLLDGLVFSRTAQDHSMNYRSVTVFGRGRRMLDTDTQRTIMEAMIARYHPQRTAGRDYEPIPDSDLKATAFIALEISEWSAKARTGGPKGPRDHDPAAPGSAGVLPLTLR